MRLVTNALQQPQGLAVRIDADRQIAVTDENQLLLLGQANRHQIRQADLFERLVGGVELAFATINQNQIGKRTALLHDLAVPPADHLLHRREVIEEPSALGNWGRPHGSFSRLRRHAYFWQSLPCGDRPLDAKLAILSLLHPP